MFYKDKLLQKNHQNISIFYLIIHYLDGSNEVLEKSTYKIRQNYEQNIR